MQRHTDPILGRKGAACGPLASRHPAYAAYARAEYFPIESPDKPVDKSVEVRRNSTKAHDIVGFRLDSENPLVAGAGFEPATFGL